MDVFITIGAKLKKIRRREMLKKILKTFSEILFFVFVTIFFGTVIFLFLLKHGIIK